jgi:hypothetical protein
MAAGLVAEANASLAKALSFDPASVDIYLFAGLFNPDAEAAARFIRTADELDSPMHLPGIAVGYQRLGLHDDAERALDRYEQWAQSEQGSAGAAEWAQYYLLRGDVDRTHTWLQAAIEKLENGEVDEGFFALQYTFTNPTHPALAAPRFRDLLQRLERLRASN